MRAYIIQSELVKKLISLLGYSDQSLVGPVTTTIGLVAVKGTGPLPHAPVLVVRARGSFLLTLFLLFLFFSVACRGGHGGDHGIRRSPAPHYAASVAGHPHTGDGFDCHRQGGPGRYVPRLRRARAFTMCTARHALLVVSACLSYRPVEHQQAGSCVPGRVKGDDRAHDLVEPGRAAARAGHPQGPRQIR